MSLVNLLESAENLQDINLFRIYNLHKLSHDRKDKYALDINGRRSGYRLIIQPINIDGTKFINKGDNLIEFYREVEIIGVEEVSNHYE
ncbi:hypothetical protein [Xylocopilactobacillus apis]|uniref:Uncharacterized protein n=1 Tax=Xylocopilactobacillus apis TaxID=2932183 RepID=A0AAU9D5C3_9LACO|nr:hypothetical protein [Xylocopilactobacillus apis]BDR57470.1 hypothetical protein KIMC2_20320 [Xylocopilactobacillus apis]BDR57520.1 hypothetical protein KIMC2_20820 [Xylocopilactobacillus apis]